jgi:hypothetical protein
VCELDNSCAEVVVQRSPDNRTRGDRRMSPARASLSGKERKVRSDGLPGAAYNQRASRLRAIPGPQRAG